jgi:hypothetical protein
MGSTNAAENIAGSVVPVLKAPFPWFGGKRKAAGAVWAKLGLTGIFLDPPYAQTSRRVTAALYREDDRTCSQAVREWAIANGDTTRCCVGTQAPVLVGRLRSRHRMGDGNVSGFRRGVYNHE